MAQASGGDRAGRREQGRRGHATHRVSPLEIVASTAGLLLTLAMLAFIGWEALTRPGDVPSAVTVEAGAVVRRDDVWVLRFQAVNHTPTTAANVGIVGTLRREGRPVETGQVVLDYVPGGSSVAGGLFFRSDPRDGVLDLRALGYAEP